MDLKTFLLNYDLPSEVQTIFQKYFIQKKQHEPDFLEKQGIAKGIINNVTLGFWEYDLVNQNFYCSPGLKSVLGLTNNEIINVFDILQYIKVEDELVLFCSLLDKHIESNGIDPFCLELTMKDKHGMEFCGACISQITKFSDQGTPEHMMGFLINITDFKNAGIRLKESENRYSNLFNKMLDGFALHKMIFDDQGVPVDYVFLDANNSFETLTGLKVANIKGKSVLDVIPNTEKSWIQTYGQVAVTGKTCRFSSYSRGLNKYFEVFAFSPMKNHFACIFTDITEIVLNDIALQKSEQKYRTLVAALPDVVMRFDKQLRHIFVSENVNQVCSLKKDDFMGKTHQELGFEKQDCDFWESNILKVFETYVSIETEFSLKNEDREIILNWRLIPEFDRSGQVKTVLTIAKDISRQKKISEELQKLQKLESIAILAGGIAHDFNNLLNGVLGNINLVSKTINNKEKSLFRLKQAEDVLLQASHLTSQLLTFSKGNQPVKEIFDMKMLISDIAKFSLSGSAIKLILSFAEHDFSVFLDKGQMVQVIQNLVMNAKQSMPKGGSILIHCENELVEQENEFSLKEGEYLKIKIKDQGIGIKKEDIGKIFDPYFSTKNNGHGLGLAVVFSIITQHKGYIAVNSNTKEGSLFTLYLPKITPLKEESCINMKEQKIKKPAKILFMDDERYLRELFYEGLSMAGYEVETAEHGEEAIDKFVFALENNESFDLVIFDFTIKGGMGGKEAMNRIREIDPDIKSIAISGYATDPVLSDPLTFGFNAGVNKPCLIDDLVNTIINVMS